MMTEPRSFSLFALRHRMAFTLALACATGGIALANWDAAPLTVHEWGVNTFDWNAGERLQQELPEHFHTDQRPGKPVAPPSKRVRDLPADSGIRTRPILYFYPGARNGRGPENAGVGIEMRFAYGHANAWWPQVNQYHNDGEGMQLVWERLTLHEEVPENQALPGNNLPDDHWAVVARNVDAAYVSNGRETERYVFYEGKTREEPAITLTNKHLRDDLPKVTPQLRKNRFLTLGQARFALEREGNHPVLPPLMKKVRELFE